MLTQGGGTETNLGCVITGIEPATFRFVVQHINYCTTAVPHC